jgi:hypothetical protein
MVAVDRRVVTLGRIHLQHAGRDERPVQVVLARGAELPAVLQPSDLAVDERLLQEGLELAKELVEARGLEYCPQLAVFEASFR